MGHTAVSHRSLLQTLTANNHRPSANGAASYQPAATPQVTTRKKSQGLKARFISTALVADHRPALPPRILLILLILSKKSRPPVSL
jgi:hypothetical protein